MLAAAVLLLVGLTLTIRWCRTAYRPWGSAAPHADSADEIAEEPTSATPSSLQLTTLRYLRGVAVGLVGGFWAGALLTGPAGRLIMRLLAVTAGEDAQGKITEAEEVVGRIDLGGSLALYIFGGILPGLLSGLIYAVIRRWLPGGILGGMTFGALHLVLAATRVDPLRPDNPDFDIVGPGWLAVATFGLAAIVHGMAVAAIANRYSQAFQADARTRRDRLSVILPLLPPLLVLVPGLFLVVPIVLGLFLTLALSRVDAIVQALRSRMALIAGRVVLVGLAVIALPTTLADVADIVFREDTAALTQFSS